MRPSLYSTLSSALGIILIIQVVKPARKGSSQIPMSLNGRNQKHSFTVRLGGGTGLGLSWTQLWRIHVLLHIRGGHVTNVSRDTSPINGSVSLQVSMWAAQERKIKTVAAQELHWGQVKARKQPELRAAGSHRAAADTSDKHGGWKGKKWKSKNTIPKPKWTNWVSHKASYKVKLGVQVTPSPKLPCGSYFAHLQSLVMVTVSEKPPSSSSADTSRCTGTEELQRGARGPAHSKCMAVPPFSASTKHLGMTGELQGWFSISQCTYRKN